jgi:hypothetical protein
MGQDAQPRGGFSAGGTSDELRFVAMPEKCYMKRGCVGVLLALFLAGQSATGGGVRPAVREAAGGGELPVSSRIKEEPVSANGTESGTMGRTDHTVPFEVRGTALYDAPAGEQPSDLYAIKVNGRPVFVYQARVSAVPENKRYEGVQRPLDQTELAAFAYWDMSSAADVEIVSKRTVEKVAVRPLSRRIKPGVDGNRITFRLSEPGSLVVEVNDFHEALHFFVNPPETDPVTPETPGVRYFGPGVHHAGRIVLQSGETVCIAGGAVVHGVIYAKDAQDVRVQGRGILDASTIPRGKERNLLCFERCRNVSVSGIILRDPHVWAAKTTECEGVEFKNVKLIGCWRYNSDGFDFVDSRNVRVADCFVRSFDDSIVMKSMGHGGADIHGITVEDCVVWTDWGVSLGITYETRTERIRDIVFRNCDVLHNMACRGALTINPSDRAEIRDVLFEDIRVEDARSGLVELVVEQTEFGKDEKRGRIRGVRFKDIAVVDGPFPYSILRGFDPDHRVEDVSFENLRIHGKLISSAEAGDFRVGPHVRDVRFSAASGSEPLE